VCDHAVDRALGQALPKTSGFFGGDLGGILRFTLSTGVVEFQLVSGSQLPLFLNCPNWRLQLKTKLD